MSTHLIRREGTFPPGGFPFVDPRTNMRFDGMQGSFENQVWKIIRHRQANPAKYPIAEPGFLDFNSVAAALDLYQCQRLGNNPKFCTDGTIQVPPDSLTRASEKVCPNCASTLTDVLCPTCSGNRVTARKCANCGGRFNP